MAHELIEYAFEHGYTNQVAANLVAKVEGDLIKRLKKGYIDRSGVFQALIETERTFDWDIEQFATTETTILSALINVHGGGVQNWKVDVQEIGACIRCMITFTPDVW